MQIETVETFVCCPGQNYVTVRIRTRDGVEGIGDATLNGRELAVASYLRDHLAPMLIGRDATAIEDTWQLLFRGAYWRRGPVAMAALAGIDMALWDIKGRALGTPVWNLLGGRCRDGLTAYTHVGVRDPAEAVDAVRAKVADGFGAVRVQAAVPGIADTYGTPRTTPDVPRAVDGGALPFVETDWSTERYLSFVPKLFERVRGEVGFDVQLLHDVHHRLTPAQAGWLGRRLEDHLLLWLEDPVQADLQTGYRLVRRHTTTPLAVGEVFTSVFDCEQLIREQLIDFVRASAVHAGGITGLRKIAALAEPYQIRTGCHGAADLSPVTMAAALHVGVATHNAAVQEFAPHPDPAGEVFDRDWTFADGLLRAGDRPGLGVGFDERAAARFPYRRAYLPVVRRTDGSVWNW